MLSAGSARVSRLHGRDLLSLKLARRRRASLLSGDCMPALICGSLAFDTIATFRRPLRRPDPAGAVAHPERLVPGADAAPRIRRLRRQHRLQPRRARRRAGGGRGGRQRRRRLPRSACARGARRPTYVRAVADSLHGAGHHHHRPRQQPDHRLPSRARCSRRTRPRVPRGDRHPAWRSSRPTAARRCSSTPRSSRRPASRSSSIPARGCRCSTARSCARFVDQASWVAVNDYEAQMLAERTGAIARSDVALAPARHRRHARRARLRAVAAAAEARHVPGVAATEVVDPTGCGDAFRGALLFGLERGWPLGAAPRSATASARSRSRSRGGQNHVLDRTFAAG